MQLVTWNVQWCCGLDGVVNPQRIWDAIQAMGEVDVVCLQEIAIHYPQLQGQPGNQLAQWQALLPGWQVFFGAAVQTWSAATSQQFGNLIATRLPVLQIQHHPLPYPAEANVRSMPRLCTVLTLQDPRLGPVRVMTTHLEYHSHIQRLAQAKALRHLHLEALAHVYAAPQFAMDGSPYQNQAHTPHAVLCGDFNFDATSAEYAALSAKAQAMECLDRSWPEPMVGTRWHDAWRVLHADQPQPATFGCFEHRFATAPQACDLVWLSDSLRNQIRSFAVDADTQASDHQPVRVVIGT